MPRTLNEKYTRFLINSFDTPYILSLKDKCNEAIKNIKGVRVDYFNENGGKTLQIYGETKEAVDRAETIILANRF